MPGIKNLGSIRTRFERSIGNYVEDVPAFAPEEPADGPAVWSDDDWLS